VGHAVNTLKHFLMLLLSVRGKRTTKNIEYMIEIMYVIMVQVEPPTIR
jgi:hypothetical protein